MIVSAKKRMVIELQFTSGRQSKCGREHVLFHLSLFIYASHLIRTELFNDSDGPIIRYAYH
jgi:hypothetical protein